MALAASHIRFSLYFREKFNITNECDYVLGSIYPDSRNITGLDRYLTHPIKEYLTDPKFKQDDFHKGWFTHLLCDDIQYALLQELLPALGESGPVGERDEVWIQRTAVKVLQDIEDANSFNIKEYLHCLSEVKNPNGEEKEKIKIYNETFHELYEHPGSLNANSYSFLWKKWGLGKELLSKIIEQAKVFETDKRLLGRIKGLHGELLEKAKQFT